MKIRSKLILGSTLITIVLIGLLYLVSIRIIQNNFLHIEDEATTQAGNQAKDGANSIISQITVKIVDWAAWDSTYDYAVGKNPEFIENNLYEATLDQLNLDAMIVIDNDGIVLGGIYRDIAKKVTDFPSELTANFTKGSKITNHPTIDTNYEGILILNDGAMAFSARPILNSSVEGPVHGTLFFGRYLSDDVTKQIQDVTHLSLSTYLNNSNDLPSDVKSAIPKLNNSDIANEILGKNQIASYVQLKDVYDKPSMIIKVLLPRTVYNEGQRSIYFFLASLSIIVIIFVLIAVFFIDKFLAKRVINISNKISDIELFNNKKLKIEDKGNDEISLLASSVNAMTERIHSSAEKISQLIEELRKEKAGVEHEVKLRTDELENEKARFLASINSMPLGFILTDVNNNVLMVNPFMAKMLSLNHKEDKLLDLIKKKLDEEPLNIILQHTQQSIKSKSNTAFEISEDNGRFLHCLMAPIFANDNTIKGIVVLIEDVTEAKIQQRSKDEFFSIASHELRTPLTAIRGNSAIIKQIFTDELKNEDLNTMLNDIHNSSVQLINIVDDFLDASSLEQGKINFKKEDFAISSVIKEVVFELNSIAKQKNVNIIFKNNVNALMEINADKSRTKQIIYNLIGNALHYTDEGSITIDVKLSNNKLIEVSVSDTGKGISAENQKLLFHKFQQAGDSILTRDTTKGTGLGLYISKLLVEGMGGSIRLVNSEINKGTTFSFSLPLSKK